MPTYTAIISRQVEHGPEIALFNASSLDIATWAGVPQRRRISAGNSSVETVGFQREEKRARVNELSRFMANPENVIQNPLLAAIQNRDYIRIDEGEGGVGTIAIEMPDFASKTLKNLVDDVRALLEKRLPSLAQRPIPMGIVVELREKLADHIADWDGESDDYDPLVGDLETIDDDAPAQDIDDAEVELQEGSIGLFDEDSHVSDFYDELTARSIILGELGKVADSYDEIGGFERPYLESLLRPVVLVDGQHRLDGALAAAADYCDSPSGQGKIAELISSGLDPETAADTVQRQHARALPVSLLVSDSPEEHVFQFVVVNQKATPMTSALLGTIVSTSLTSDELALVQDRLTDAGIKISSAVAVSSISKDPRSPFYGLIGTGVRGDKPKALPWTVALRLANMVRDLEGGKSYHAPQLDYVKIWKNKNFSQCGLIPDFVEEGARREYWSSARGPWFELFIRLHQKIRDTFGNPDDMDARNAWGSTDSNLFNMVSLSILTQDFFNFLGSSQYALLQGWNDVDLALDAWLDGLSGSYFDRDWRMKGTKKDQTKIKEAWSANWFGYRIERGKLPRVDSYNPGGK